MPEDTHQAGTGTARPAGIGLFWFITLIAGFVTFGPQKQLPRSASAPPSISDDAQALNHDPVRLLTPRTSTAVETTVARPHHDVTSWLDTLDPPIAAVSLNVTPESAARIGIVGPRQRTVGSRAEFVVTLVNEAETEWTGAEFALEYAPALRLKEVSAGARREPGRLHWDLGTVRPNERIQVQVEFECVAVVASARLTATVTADDRPAGQSETLLEIKSPAQLDLRLSDAADPLQSGDTSTFVVSIENLSSQPARNIVLHLVPSGGIDISAVRVRHGDRELGLQAFVVAGGLFFDTVPSLESGDQLTYEIEFEARAVGAGELRALLQAQTLATPLEVHEPIVINP